MNVVYFMNKKINHICTYRQKNVFFDLLTRLFHVKKNSKYLSKIYKCVRKKKVY